MKNNTESISIAGNDVCKYCGSNMKREEERMGFDYREEGDIYVYCMRGCKGSLAEPDYKAKKGRIFWDRETAIEEFKEAQDLKVVEKLAELDEEYKEVLKQMSVEQQFELELEMFLMR